MHDHTCLQMNGVRGANRFEHVVDSREGIPDAGLVGVRADGHIEGTLNVGEFAVHPEGVGNRQ